MKKNGFNGSTLRRLLRKKKREIQVSKKEQERKRNSTISAITSLEEEVVTESEDEQDSELIEEVISTAFLESIESISLSEINGRLPEKKKHLKELTLKEVKCFRDGKKTSQAALEKILEKILESFGIVRQAYHSNQLIGEHCRRLLKFHTEILKSWRKFEIVLKHLSEEESRKILNVK